MPPESPVEPIDAAFLAAVEQLEEPSSGATTDEDLALRLFDAQLESRHLDLAARWLQRQGEGFYTIGSAGHEANAALGLLTRVDDPALLHYRSGGFFAARALRHAAERPAEATDAVRDVLLGLTAAAADPISGGRHKVFGHPALHVIPQTSTIASHLPRAVGLAFALDSLRDLAGAPSPWPDDAIVVCSFGDASVNHSTAQGSLNAAAYLTHRRLPLPLLLVCEDNGIGISTRTPAGWTEKALRRHEDLTYVHVPVAAAPDLLFTQVRRAVDLVRTDRRPVVLHLETVRFMGHAGSDAELAYRTRAEIAADHARDPLLATARHLVAHGVLTRADVRNRYEAVRERVLGQARSLGSPVRLASRDEVVAPLARVRPRRRADRPVTLAAGERDRVWGGKLPEDAGPLTLAQAVNAALTDVMLERGHVVVFGEDVGLKGGVYGLTRGLQRRFGGRRVFDTLLDEQTILGLALGSALTGVLPLPEIQYLAYVHNAEDQLRGEAASLPFFSSGAYRNPMVVRIAGLAYQKGFGGHFHNDNSVAVLRDVPGLVVCVPSHPADAPALLRACVDLADTEGRVCVFLEPIALYHAPDLHEPGDGGWAATYDVGARTSLGETRTHGDGRDLLIVTFGNGVPMSLRAARALEREGVRTSVLDLRWLAPLPVDALLAEAGGFPHVLVVDETRASGGVADAVVAALVESALVESALVESAVAGAVAAVRSADSFVPLGPAADSVLLGVPEIVDAARALMADR